MAALSNALTAMAVGSQALARTSRSGRAGAAFRHLESRHLSFQTKARVPGTFPQSSLLSVDRSGLLQFAPADEGIESRAYPVPKKNELAKEIYNLVQARGPITIAEYMKMALSHPQYGYYMRGDVFGQKGDFTTAPEISQMFGELLGVWCVATWEALGRPEQISVVELGPGRGTLMADLLRAVDRFTDFKKAASIHLVETSKALQTIQKQTLKPKALGIDTPNVSWHNDLAEVQPGALLVIAQELLDALPVHQFVLTDRGWREVLLKVRDTGSEYQFYTGLSPGPTLAIKAYIESLELIRPGRQESGTQVEISPQALGLFQTVSRRIQQDRGAALFIDYGSTEQEGISLRGISDHKFVHPFHNPGMADLTADVDFRALARSVKDYGGIKISGPSKQGDFLGRMGIMHRLEALLQNADESQGELLVESCRRLVEDGQMGSVYKVLSVCHESVEHPVGF